MKWIRNLIDRWENVPYREEWEFVLAPTIGLPVIFGGAFAVFSWAHMSGWEYFWNTLGVVVFFGMAGFLGAMFAGLGGGFIMIEMERDKRNPKRDWWRR